MDPALFLTDLLATPERLAELDHSSFDWPVADDVRRVVLTGMGSSYFAARSVATRLRSSGLTVIAERSSVMATWPAADDLLVVGISASGSSAETLGLMAQHHRVSRTLALTNTADGPIAGVADATVDLVAGDELGGVACRSYHHTLLALLALGNAVGAALGVPTIDIGGLAGRAAEAAADLIERRDEWLAQVANVLDGPDGLWILAPEERLGNALQGGLMVREGPRRAADGCETGDWSHVDVYLTKTLDYRALVFPGSRFDRAAAEWMASRSSRVVSVGGDFPGAAYTLRYRHDDDPLVRMVVEALVPELLAAHWWSRATLGGNAGAIA
jgi:glutamine---fructose-6-phosphate transaminase (isomerizing)